MRIHGVEHVVAIILILLDAIADGVLKSDGAFVSTQRTVDEVNLVVHNHQHVLHLHLRIFDGNHARFDVRRQLGLPHIAAGSTVGRIALGSTRRLAACKPGDAHRRRSQRAAPRMNPRRVKLSSSFGISYIASPSFESFRFEIIVAGRLFAVLSGTLKMRVDSFTEAFRA